MTYYELQAKHGQEAIATTFISADYDAIAAARAAFAALSDTPASLMRFGKDRCAEVFRRHFSTMIGEAAAD